MATHRFPRSVSLLGYKLKIRQTTTAKLSLIAKDDRILQGFWDDSTDTIYLIRGDSFRQKTETLRHELEHAFTDLMERYLDTITRRYQGL